MTEKQSNESFHVFLDKTIFIEQIVAFTTSFKDHSNIKSSKICSISHIQDFHQDELG